MTNLEYWQNELEAWLLATEDAIIQYEKTKLLPAYKIATKEIQKAVLAFIAKYAENGRVVYATVNYTLTPNELEDYRAQVIFWYKEAKRSGYPESYLAYLEKLNKLIRVTRLRQLNDEIIFELQRLAVEKNKSAAEIFLFITESSYYTYNYLISKGLDFTEAPKFLSSESLYDIISKRINGDSFSSSFGKDLDKLISKFGTVVPQSFAMNLSNRDILKRIVAEMNISENQAKTTIRTLNNFFCNQAALQDYKNSKIKEYMFLAVLDSVTTKTCRGLNEQVFEISKAAVGINYPPMHFNCRSVTLPKIDGSKEFASKYNKTRKEYVDEYLSGDTKSTVLKFINTYMK